VGSMPIPIQFPTAPPALSLASYHPGTIQTDMVGGDQPVSPVRRNASSEAVRRAVYAERDLRRSRDPGASDFMAEVEENDREDEPDETNTAPDGAEVGGRGRQQALRILQSRSEIPEAGMWRSLAS